MRAFSRTFTIAKEAVVDLKAAGFTEEQIGLAMRERFKEPVDTTSVDEEASKAGEEAAKGLVSGGLLGGMTGLLVATGVIAIPGLGPIIAGGALVSAFGLTGGAMVTGAGVGAAAGGLIGGLVGQDIPETEARHYEAGLREGRVLVRVKTIDR